MRICDINNFYSPTGGGVRVYLDHKRRYFEERGEHAYALVVPSNRFAKTDTERVAVYEIPALRVGRTGYRFIVSPRSLRRVMEDFQPDVVEIGSPYVLPLIASRAMDEGVATVGFYHADYPDAYVKKIASRFSNRLARPLSDQMKKHVRWVYGRMTAVFGASGYALDKLHAAGVRRLFRTPLGVDSDIFCPGRRSESLRADLGAGPEKKLVLYLARLTTENGIDLLMEAYPAFRDPERAVLAIAGHGPFERRLEPFLKRHPEVVRLPFVEDRVDVARLMASADVFLSMSNDETFGLAIAEAMASGTHVIAPNAGAAAELLHGSGILQPYRPRDAGSLAEHVAAALEIERSDRAEQLRAYAQTLDWSVTFDRITRFYAKIVAAKRDDAVGGLVPSSPNRWHEWDPTSA